MKKKNGSWIILVILVLIIIGVFIYMKNANQEKNDSYIVYNDSAVFRYHKEKWEKISKEENGVFDNRFDVYMDNSYEGKFEIRYVNDKWYYFDENMDSKDLSGEMFAYYSKNDILLAKNKIEQVNSEDVNYINKALKKKKIMVDENTNYIMNEKISYDVDSDGKNETIYALSNADVLEDLTDTFSTVFYVKNNKVHTLLLENYTNESENIVLYSINNLFTFKNEDKYYLSINEFSDMNNDNNNTILYGLDLRNKYKLEISSNSNTKRVSNKSSLTILWIILPIILLVIGGYIFYKKTQEEEID